MKRFVLALALALVGMTGSVKACDYASYSTSYAAYAIVQPSFVVVPYVQTVAVAPVYSYSAVAVAAYPVVQVQKVAVVQKAVVQKVQVQKVQVQKVKVQRAPVVRQRSFSFSRTTIR